MFDFKSFFSELRNFRNESDAQPLAKATAEVDRLKLALATYEKESDSFDVEIKQAKSDLETAKASILSLTKERDGFKAILDDPKSEIETRAAAKAVELMAKTGVTPLPADKTEPDKTGQDVKAQFQKMAAGPERTAFFRKHKTQLI